MRGGRSTGQRNSSTCELLITTDTNLHYQQNLRSRSIAILVLTTTSWPRIRQVAGEIQAAVAAIQEGDYRELPLP